jgi:hypothetical protein
MVFAVNYAYAAAVPLNEDGVATYSTTALVPGPDSNVVQAGYVGHSTFGPSDAQLIFTVEPAELPPTFSPLPGKYIGSVSVTLSDATSNSTIYYTLDGSPPTTSSPVYEVPFTISSGYVIVRAIATISGYPPGPEAVGAYSIVAQTPPPVISPASGTYPVGQAITITDADPTATIRYTTDGSTPTTHSDWYHEPIVLTGPETIKSIAISTGRANSEVTSTVYTTP